MAMSNPGMGDGNDWSSGFGRPFYKPSTKPSAKTPVVKINSNPNPTPAKGVRNPTQAKLNADEMNEPVYDKYGYPATPVVKVRTSGLSGREIGAMDHQGGHGLGGGSTGGNSSGVSIKYTK